MPFKRGQAYVRLASQNMNMCILFMYECELSNDLLSTTEQLKA